MFALREFSQHGLRPEQLEILIGPAAGVCCYEVGPDLIEILKQSWGETGLVRREDKFYFNLAALLREQALSWGLRPEAIACAQVCTICDFRFFSFRRQKDLSGRQLSFISSV
jgi:copper oxidase (laccase) domain-containing protein